MHLVGFNIEIYYDARPYERHITCKGRSQSGNCSRFGHSGLRNISRFCFNPIQIMLPCGLNLVFIVLSPLS